MFTGSPTPQSVSWNSSSGAHWSIIHGSSHWIKQDPDHVSSLFYSLFLLSYWIHTEISGPICYPGPLVKSCMTATSFKDNKTQSRSWGSQLKLTSTSRQPAYNCLTSSTGRGNRSQNLPPHRATKKPQFLPFKSYSRYNQTRYQGTEGRGVRDTLTNIPGRNHPGVSTISRAKQATRKMIWQMMIKMVTRQMFIFHTYSHFILPLFILQSSPLSWQITHMLPHTTFDRLSKDVLHNSLLPLVEYCIILIAEVITVTGKASYSPSSSMWGTIALACRRKMQEDLVTHVHQFKTEWSSRTAGKRRFTWKLSRWQLSCTDSNSPTADTVSV